MEADHTRNRTELDDYLAVLTQAGDDGQPFIVVGEAKRKESLENYIRALTALKHNYSGRQFEAQHPGVLHWAEMIPPRVRQMTFERDVQNFLRQLTGTSQSRGIGI
jgi:hypothetical protein